MEKFLQESRGPEKSVEASANYEGNHAILFLERMKTPEIRERLIDHLYEHVTTTKNKYYKEKYAATKEEIGEKLDSDIEKAFHSTDIDYFDGVQRNAIGENKRDEILEKSWVVMHLGAKHLVTGEAYGTKVYNVTEAHEKGHFIRYFDPDLNSDFQKRLLGGFDPSRLSFSKEEIEAARKLILDYKPEPLTEEHIRVLQEKHYPGKSLEWVRETHVRKPVTEVSDEQILKYQKHYQTNPNELLERMSQLKNYFGMSGTEPFTKKHLEYARKHYAEDTGMHDILRPFFDMITPETEEKFIELMNTLGI